MRYNLVKSLMMSGVCLAVLGGCATARMVESEPEVGGVVTIAPQGNEEARQKAEALMRQTCAGKTYKIVKEGEVVVGSRTEAKQNETPKEDKNLFGKKTKSVETSSSTSTSNVTEWRLTFKCQK